MTKRFSVTVRYSNGRVAAPVIVDSIEAIVKNLRIMKEGDTFQITRIKFTPLRIRDARKKRDEYRR